MLNIYMPDNPIASDIAFISDIVDSTQTSVVMMSANAQSAFNLQYALLSNSQLAYSKMWVDTFIASRVDYLSSFYSAHTTLTADSTPQHGYYGDINSYFGNLDMFYISVSGHSAGNINTTTSLTQSAYTLSAGPTYYSLSSRVTFTTPTTSVLTSVLQYHADRYSFACQYLWANPSNSSQATTLATLPAVNNYNVKFGVNNSATSLQNAATGMQQDIIFYANKRQYLSTLV